MKIFCRLILLLLFAFVSGIHCYAATYIIAAADSKNVTDPVANFSCTGISDQNVIHDAMHSLSSNGGELVLLDGTYNFSGSLVIDVNNVTITGSGPATTIAVAGSFLPHTAGQPYVIDMPPVGIHDINIFNLRIVGSGTSLTDPAGIHGPPNSHNIRVANCSFYNLGWVGSVDYSNSYNGIIENNFINTSGYGITLSGGIHSFGVLVKNNIILNSIVGICSQNGSNHVIAGNRIDSLNINSFGIILGGTSSSTIHGNAISTYGQCLYTEPGLPSSQPQINNLTIIGNTMLSTHSYAMKLCSVGKSIVADNAITSQLWDAVLLTRLDTSHQMCELNQVKSNIITVGTYFRTGIRETNGDCDRDLFESNIIDGVQSPYPIIVVSGQNSISRLNLNANHFTK